MAKVASMEVAGEQGGAPDVAPQEQGPVSFYKGGVKYTWWPKG